jgi:hypothetical protein
MALILSTTACLAPRKPCLLSRTFPQNSPFPPSPLPIHLHAGTEENARVDAFAEAYGALDHGREPPTSARVAVGRGGDVFGLLARGDPPPGRPMRVLPGLDRRRLLAPALVPERVQRPGLLPQRQLHVLSGVRGRRLLGERVPGGLPAPRLMRRRQVRLLRRVHGRGVR